MIRTWLPVLLALVALPAAAAPVRDVQYGKVPAWVLATPPPSPGPTPADAPGRMIYSDMQVRIDKTGGEEQFSAYRYKILKPEGLAAGNISIAWSPDAGAATVHYLRIIRGTQTLDILAGNKFQILQREGGLEQSMLDGQLTATLQVPGLQLGDELEFAVTLTMHEPAFGDHIAGIGGLPAQGMPGAFRYRLIWPEAKPLVVRATKDLPQLSPAKSKSENVLVYELQDPLGSIPTEGAPTRFNIRRMIEFSDFASWKDVSRQMWPLFEKAAQLPPGSPIRAEAAKIAAASADPVARAQAALRLVQDRIRYVYVGLDGGNYTPATAESSWERRFGDCKAKTVLLLALLRELGIAAEPMLVNLAGGDGTDERLPSPRMFDHVLVQARIGTRDYLLDGTRLGDRYLDNLNPSNYRWGLPLRGNGADLQRVKPVLSPFPQYIGVFEIDARAGIGKPAKVTAQNIVRGDEAIALQTQLGALSATDAERAVTGYWEKQIDWVEPDKVSWRYDERRAALIFSLTGTGTPEWEGDAGEGHSLTLPGAGFMPPDKLRRSKDQDQMAAWAIEFPRFRCWATTVWLPAASAGWRWTYHARPVDRQLGGIEYWRAAGLADSVIRTVMSRQSLTSEISAADAISVNAAIAGFDNDMSTVSETKSLFGGKTPDETLPFGETPDWINNPEACSRPAGKAR